MDPLRLVRGADEAEDRAGSDPGALLAALGDLRDHVDVDGVTGVDFREFEDVGGAVGVGVGGGVGPAGGEGSAGGVIKIKEVEVAGVTCWVHAGLLGRRAVGHKLRLALVHRVETGGDDPHGCGHGELDGGDHGGVGLGVAADVRGVVSLLFFELGLQTFLLG